MLLNCKNCFCTFENVNDMFFSYENVFFNKLTHCADGDFVEDVAFGT